MTYMDGVVAPLKREREYFYDNPECHYGDHYWQDNGQCRDCSAFNGGMLQWAAVEKAEREGRHHGDHFHRTIEKAASCRRQTHDQRVCADKGGCLHHDASDAFMAALEETTSTAMRGAADKLGEAMG